VVSVFSGHTRRYAAQLALRTMSRYVDLRRISHCTGISHQTLTRYRRRLALPDSKNSEKLLACFARTGASIVEKSLVRGDLDSFNYAVGLLLALFAESLADEKPGLIRGFIDPSYASVVIAGELLDVETELYYVGYSFHSTATLKCTLHDCGGSGVSGRRIVLCAPGRRGGGRLAIVVEPLLLEPCLVAAAVRRLMQEGWRVAVFGIHCRGFEYERGLRGRLPVYYVCRGVLQGEESGAR